MHKSLESFNLSKDEEEYLKGTRVFWEVQNLIYIIGFQKRFEDAQSFSRYIMEMVAAAGAQFGMMHEVKHLLSILKKKDKDLEDVIRIGLLTYKLLLTTCLKTLDTKGIPFNVEGAKMEMMEVEAETEEEIKRIREMRKQHKFKVGV